MEVGQQWSPDQNLAYNVNINFAKTTAVIFLVFKYILRSCHNPHIGFLVGRTQAIGKVKWKYLQLIIASQDSKQKLVLPLRIQKH